tara:strand:- start:1384 stop:2046 length:663 start_codon:yes stop_codon:yes gene_type:complete
MKLALLGKGKTGAKVLEKFPAATVFDSKNVPNLEKLQGHDVIISFLPGEAFVEYIPLLKASKIPVVTGSTGFSWPSSLDTELKSQGTAWVHATNFSLGMNLVRQMIGILSNAESLFSNAEFKIHEIHHTKKLDAPSGTALSWKEWAKADCEITSERIGDVVGTHEITMNTPNESIFLRHTAHDRGIFAEGAIWSANFLLNSNKVKPGLNAFADVILKELV